MDQILELCTSLFLLRPFASLSPLNQWMFCSKKQHNIQQGGYLVVKTNLTSCLLIACISLFFICSMLYIPLTIALEGYNKPLCSPISFFKLKALSHIQLVHQPSKQLINETNLLACPFTTQIAFLTFRMLVNLVYQLLQLNIFHSDKHVNALIRLEHHLMASLIQSDH